MEIKSGYCACGKLLHYNSDDTKEIVELIIQDKGEMVNVTVENITYFVQRHYIALHGIKASELPNLGFDIVNQIPLL